MTSSAIEFQFRPASLLTRSAGWKWGRRGCSSGPRRPHHFGVPSTPRRRSQALIARLEGELAASRAVEERSRAQRAEHALAAAEGTASAQKALGEASHAAAMAVLDSENLELAIGSARERLASLEAEAEAERLEGVRQRAVIWLASGVTLPGSLMSAGRRSTSCSSAGAAGGKRFLGLRDGNPRLYLPHQTESVRPLLMALPDELRTALRSAPDWVHPTAPPSARRGRSCSRLAARRRRASARSAGPVLRAA